MTEEERSSRTRSKRNRKKKKKFKIIKNLFFLIIVLGVIGAATVGIVTYNIIKDTEPIDPNNIYSLLSENSFIYDEDGNVIEKVQYADSRTNVDYLDMPKNLLNAFIAIEDKTFETHKGFNIIRIFGAIWEGISKGENIRGTSTITQQLARNLYLSDKKSERSMDRKIQEAYYTVLLERSLSKAQIIEAYLNTIYLGFGTSGVQAASQAFFSKDIQKLSIAECAVLAGIPKNPSKYAPIKRLRNESISEEDSSNIISVGETYTLLYNDQFRDRQLLVLHFMREYGFISQQEYDEAVNADMRTLIKPSFTENIDITSYFTDKVKSDVIDALMAKYKIDEKEAYDMLYSSGLKIYSTIDLDIQKIVEKEFKEETNFPDVNATKDRSGNILDKQNKVLLYKYENLFKDKAFIVRKGDYQIDSNGNLVLLKNKRLDFYSVKENDKIKDINITIKDFYKNSDNVFTITRGGRILVPNIHKKLDDNGNVVISKAFLDENPNFFKKDQDDNYIVGEKQYSLNEEIIQPQSAMVIIDPYTGGIKALVGGRNIQGKMLFSRATNPNPPGSSIKPLSVYTPALDKGWSAASIIDDVPLYNEKGEAWPSNWYSHPGYKGLVTLRYAVQQSINVVAVKVLEQIGINTSMSYLKEFGITSLVESGYSNDANLAALSLGGMTKGVSPLEMTAAYGTLANKGIYIQPITFTRIEDRNGNVIIENIPEKHRVVNEDVAFLMTDILTSAVRSGTGSRARLYEGNVTIPVAGKTGTTSSNYDAWFMGYTPYYAAGLWIGNDLDIELSQGSAVSANLWSKIMKEVHKNLPAKDFEKPENIITVTVDSVSGKLPTDLSYLDPRGTVVSEYFIPGTEPTEYDDIHALANIDIFTNRLATPLCPPQLIEQRVFTQRPYPLVQMDDPNELPADYIYEMPRYYCPLHNPSYYMYPTDIDMDDNMPVESDEENDSDLNMDIWQPSDID
ncbi:MAG: PBP1A family penicillin-binding protein [Clostridiales bacterium]|nr:PBP1A family penicillin-binding protein [Clostridiales bacterium]